MAMQTFTPFEYLMIAIANAQGLDKKLFEERIEWTKSNGKHLRNFIDDAEDKPKYVRCVMELERLLSGQTKSNLMIGLDATASQLQMMSALCGCHKSAYNVNLIDPTKRLDVYMSLLNAMNQYLPEDKWIQASKDGIGGGFTRDSLKKPLMHSLYDSTKTPRDTFGKGSIELTSFYNALDNDVAVGCRKLQADIRAAYEYEKLQYEVTMPDGFEAITKVMRADDKTVELEELLNPNGNASHFTHRIKINAPDEEYRALGADMIHRTDSFVLRELKRRTRHNKVDLLKVMEITEGCRVTNTDKFISLREVELLLKGKQDYSDNDLGQLRSKIELVIDNPVFDVVSVHDEFECHLTNMNYTRKYYADILAEIAESRLCENLLQQLYGKPSLAYEQEGDGKALAQLIRQANYHLS